MKSKFINPVSTISASDKINFTTITNGALTRLKATCDASTSSEPKNFTTNILEFYGYIYTKLAENKDANEWIKKFATSVDYEIIMAIFLESLKWW